jgi:hypothetical protein
MSHKLPPNAEPPSAPQGIPLEKPYPDILRLSGYDGITFTFYVIAFITTLMRLYCRLVLMKNFGLDDFLITIATLSALSIVVIGHYAVQAYLASFDYITSLGMFPLGDPMLVQLSDVLFRYGSLGDFIYILVVPFVKCAILAFYCRLATNKKHLYVLYSLMFVVAVQAIINFAFALYAYKPLSGVWNLSTGELNGTFEFRYTPTILQISHGSFQTLFDLIILAIPPPFLYKMKLGWNKKIGLIVIYCLSFVSLAATIVRLAESIDFHISQGSSDDLLHTFVSRIDYVTWTMIEVTTAIICANLPALYALVRLVRGVDQPSTGVSSSQPKLVSSWSKPFHRWVSAARLDSSKGWSRRSRRTKGSAADVESADRAQVYDGSTGSQDGVHRTFSIDQSYEKAELSPEPQTFPRYP